MKFSNLELALGTNLKFYTSVPKGLKVKVRKFWELILTFVEVAGEKLVGGGGRVCPPFLSRAKEQKPTVKKKLFKPFKYLQVEKRYYS